MLASEAVASVWQAVLMAVHAVAAVAAVVGTAVHGLAHVAAGVAATVVGLVTASRLFTRAWHFWRHASHEHTPARTGASMAWAAVSPSVLAAWQTVLEATSWLVASFLALPPQERIATLSLAWLMLALLVFVVQSIMW